MSPVAQSGESEFSQCSIGNICESIPPEPSSSKADPIHPGAVMTGVAGGKINTNCLVDPDPNRQTIGLQMCGNGIVERGEDCDPGKDVESTCCDSATCKFRGNALCDPDSSPCCTEQCSFAPTTQLCRPSKDAKCDMPEMCTGNSSSCPTDVVQPNG